MISNQFFCGATQRARQPHGELSPGDPVWLAKPI
jgi:hypothetical protein